MLAEVGRGLKAFEREIKELNLVLFPEALAHAVRMATRTLAPPLPPIPIPNPSPHPNPSSYPNLKP